MEWKDDRIEQKQIASPEEKMKFAQKEYLKKINAAKRNNYLVKIVCNIIIVICIINMIAASTLKIQKIREEQHEVISVKDLNVYNETIEKQVYPVSYSEKYTLKNKTYYDLTIGSYTIVVPEETIVALKENTMLETEIYHLTIENKAKYLLSAYDSSSVEFIRIPALGQAKFSDEDVKKYEKKD